ncbi:hypothetical protein [Paeniglutamicibacter cryotolerans]|uniref:LLM class flavin-dependent oxidoreductase n=1 Tax=Paeniglutamicibacter cryotolerans TaxID=670079 RepID=A0A839QLT4_9MICC|nr:hypothetical protein [Paeniglutamicibacter cryotolerans]MBB2997388.1 hypothetical protein [Paeniglutamicibacter cryotolerans]
MEIGAQGLGGAPLNAGKAGLDYFGVGEHTRLTMTASPPGALIAASAAATSRITLGSAANIISTDRFAPSPELLVQGRCSLGTCPGRAQGLLRRPGLTAPVKKEPLERFYPGWHRINIERGPLCGRPAPDQHHFLQLDSRGLPREHFLEVLTLLAAEVKPRVGRLPAAK